MKTPSILLLFICSICQGQTIDSVTQYSYYVKASGNPYSLTLELDTISQDTLNAICKERGHVKGENATSTLMWCEPYIIDTDSTTIKVYPACNYTTWECLRCGELFTEREKERRQVIWRKQKAKPKLMIGDPFEVEYVYPIDTIKIIK